MLKGIDVSEHQGRINWEQVKDHIDFAILRAGYGRNNIDKQFIRNIEECNRLGIPVGIYWFSYAHDVAGAKAEANYVLEAIKPYKIDYPVCYDFEYDTLRYASQQGFTIGKRLATDMINTFCSTIEQAGYKAMNYANPDFINNKFYNNEVNYPLWLAWYGVSEDKAKAYNPAMWQYSESGSIAGIGTNSVDMNYCYENFMNNSVSKPTITNNIKANARVVNDFLYARDSEGNKVGGYASEGDEIEVLDVSDSRQLALIKYPTPNGAKERYVTNATNCIEYFYQDQYKNGSTPEPVYQDSSCSQKIGTLNPYEKATPIYRKDGVLHVVYSTWKGRNTKSGFVKYNGGFDKF